MKKILSIIFAIMLIFSCFAISVFAEDDLLFTEDSTYVFEDAIARASATISDDYQKLYVNGDPYSRIDASMLSVEYIITVAGDYYEGDNVIFELSEAQKKEIKEVYAERNTQRNIFYVNLTFNDGAVLSITFLKDDCLDEYNNLINGDVDEYTIDFVWPEGNVVLAQKGALFGDTVTKTDNQLARNEYFDVMVQSSDGSLVMYKGNLFINGDEFYYLDFKENGLKDTWVNTAFGDVSKFTLHKITDQELISALKSAEESYYDDDYGYLYDDSLTESVSAVFLIFVFAVVPFVIFVIFLIKTIRGKGVYKKIYGTVSALCIAELIVFIIIAIIITSVAPAFEFTLTEKTGEDYAIEMDVDLSSMEVCLLKEAVYCGDGGCTDGCNTGYFYYDRNCSEEYAMENLGLGEPDGVSDEYFGYKTIYRTSFEENIVVDTTEYENGYIVEYMVIGVG